MLYNKKNLALLLGLGGILLASALPVQAKAIDDNTIIEEGVFSQGIDLSGKTAAQARTLIDEHFRKISDSQLTVTFSDQQETIALSDLKLEWDTDSTVQQAAGYAKSGPLIARYKEKIDLKYDNADVPVTYTYDSAAVTTFVTEQIASHDTEPVNASLYREDGEFHVEDDEKGLKTDIEKSVQAICQVLDTQLTDATTAEAIVEVAEPEITADMLSEIHDRLGTYTTDYSSSSYNRKTNIKVAAGRLNGQLLMPGDSISVSDTILSRNEENGYMMAPQYANGQTEDSYGGGVCQVSTTLYNAVIRAELEIDERSPHSMVVHYVPYASDAAIAEGNKDFIFHNSTDYPIYIAASADGYELTFSIYGKETRSEDRTIEFISNTISEEYPEARIEYDDSQYEGYESTTGSSSPAVTATLTKVIYENGVEVDRILLHTDHYNGQFKTTIKGTRKKEPETTKPHEPETPEAEEPDEPDEPEEDEDDYEDSGEMIDPPEEDDYDE